MSEQKLKSIEEKIKCINYKETDYKFENSLSEICAEIVNKRDKALDAEFENAIKKSWEENKDNEIGYKFFFCLNTFYRYKKRYDDLDALIVGYKHLYFQHESFTHLKLLSNLASKKNLSDCFKLALERAQKYSENAGDLHLFTDIVVTQYEIESKFILNQPEQISDYWLDAAEKSLEEAIRIKGDYAKFYCTKARLLALKKDYSNALREINRAIDLEDEANELKISHYHFVRMIIFDKDVEEKIRRNEENIKKLEQANEEKMKEIMHKSTAKSYEIMAFFIGIISFIIGSINFSANLPAKDLIFVLIAFLGALLCAFYCLGFVLNSSKLSNLKDDRPKFKIFSVYNIPLFLGILLLSGALALCFFIL